MRLSPLGARLEGIDLAGTDRPGGTELRQLLADHAVVVIPGQRHLDDTGFAALLRSLGELVLTTGEVPVPGHPELNVVTNVGRERPPVSHFHTDTSYLREPPAYTGLRAVAVPEAGGSTLFADQRRAADTLPDALRRRVEGRSIRHIATGVELGPGDEAAAEHPILRRHPRSGCAALYLSTPVRCAGVSGLDDARAADLVADLLAHATAPPLVLTHRWSPGDVVVWDNRSVLHRAVHDDVVGARTFHRGTVVDPDDRWRA